MSRLRRRIGRRPSGPDRVTGQLSLKSFVLCALCRAELPTRITTYLEIHPRLNLLPKHRSNMLIEVGHDAHRKLRLDATAADQIIERIRQRETDAEGYCISTCSRHAVESSEHTMCLCKARRSPALLAAPFSTIVRVRRRCSWMGER